MGAKPNTNKLQEQMQQQSLELQKLALSQPKPTTSDNFAANKLKSIGALRMGLASTISAPAVNSMKNKLGV